MKILMDMKGVSEHWDADTGESRHILHVEYAGTVFDFAVSEEEIAAIVKKATSESTGDEPLEWADPSDYSDVPDGPQWETNQLGTAADADAEFSVSLKNGEPEEGSMTGFKIAEPEDEVVEAPVAPSPRGRQPVPRARVQRDADGEFCGQG